MRVRLLYLRPRSTLLSRAPSPTPRWPFLRLTFRSCCDMPWTSILIVPRSSRPNNNRCCYYQATCNLIYPFAKLDCYMVLGRLEAVVKSCFWLPRSDCIKLGPDKLRPVMRGSTVTLSFLTCHKEYRSSTPNGSSWNPPLATSWTKIMIMFLLEVLLIPQRLCNPDNWEPNIT